ncbi:MAG: exodeoxyribonuclease III [Bdellovibrionales bacterium]
MAIKLLSWNVNGLRACGRAGFGNWFSDQAADVVCLQEIKVQSEQLTPELLNPSKYNSFWHSAEKPGYSGVAIFSKREPLDVRYGIGNKEIDREGRVITAEFKNHIVINSYFPNSQRDHARLDYKLAFCDAFLKYCNKELKKGKSVLICGDLNIAHDEIDLKNPKTNTKNAGFLPEERAWMTKFLKAGYVDSFRHFSQDPGQYTWWSYRPGVRERNIGWRLDYFLSDEDSRSRFISTDHQSNVMGSEHCPVALKIKI